MVQGIVIVSCVRANGCGRLGFLSDQRRLNVVLTRAIRALVVVGHKDTLCSSSLWAQWISQATHMPAK